MLPLKDNVPTRTFPVVTVALIARTSSSGSGSGRPGVESDVLHYGYYPCAVDGPCVAPPPSDHLPWYEGVFTSMFMHASWLHIGGNMLFLWIFGNNVEDALGRVRFLLWYLAGRARGDGARRPSSRSRSPTRRGASIPNVGASGAIAGVLGAYLVLLPARARADGLLFAFFFLREIPAVLFLGIWFVLPARGGRLRGRSIRRRAAASPSSRTSAASRSGRDGPVRRQATAVTAILVSSGDF